MQGQYVWHVTVKRTALPTLHQFNKSSWKYDKLFLDHETTLTGDLVYGFELSCWMDVYYFHCYSPLCFLATNILNQSNSLGSRSGWRMEARHNQLKQISFSIPMLIGWQLGQKKSVKTPEMLIVLLGKACNKPSQSFQCQEKAPFVYLGAFSVIVKSSRRFVSTSIAPFLQRARWSYSI